MRGHGCGRPGGGARGRGRGSVPAAKAYQGATYGPIITYYYAQLQAELAKINGGKITGSEAATELQATMVKYAKSQGFKVTQ